MAREVESHSGEQVTVVADLVRDSVPTVVLEALQERDVIHRSATPIEAKIEHLFSRIEAELATHPLEDGYIHPAEALLFDQVFDGSEAKAVFDHVFHKSDFSADLIRLLGRSKPFTEHWRLRMVEQGLRSTQIAIRDAVLQAAESWADPGQLPLLKQHVEPTRWLRQYLHSVIRELEG